MLKVWNMALIQVTFFLCIFGTFIVRSGVITSVHSFAQSAIGPYFLVFLATVVAGSLALLFYRVPLLRSDNQLDSVLSREASFLLNNLLFIGLVFATFWGTIYPLISEAVQGLKITVGPPFFNQVNGPIMLALVVLMGIGPLMPWRKATGQNLIRNFSLPIGMAGLTLLGLLAFVGPEHPMALAAFSACAFVLATIVQEFWRGAIARHHATGESYIHAFGSLVRRNNRRYGGYVVHIGVIVIAAAVTGSSIYQVEQQAKLRPGESVDVGGYRLTYGGVREIQEPGVRVVQAQVAVESGGQLLGGLQPSKRFHRNFERQPSTEVAIRSSALADVYVVLVGWEADGSASFLVFVNPLVIWLWIGGVIAAVGAFIALWPDPQPRLVSVRRPAPGLATSGA
jgi:cytochrome c-type biogenesis protein CcmF